MAASTIHLTRGDPARDHHQCAQAHQALVPLQRSRVDPGPAETNALDVAISRFGTMFFGDPVAAFTNVARSLRDGARLCLATWQPLADNDWLTIPGRVLLRYGQLPDTSGTAPGKFAQSDPDVVADVLGRAGYRDVDVRPLTLSLRLGADAAEATAHLANTGVGSAVLATIPEEQHQRPSPRSPLCSPPG